ncbi:MAG: energy-coupling factor transporter ATPase [Caldiserica bacterium]|jgi:energy-coupling factor transport system ATP-binding protein|nr:energy-coupling factor transporter ATPase [Caldisericota bacterium]MDH7563152.1 energy-coupling factor transporter ATPase [Caldisericota bacterium]
MRIEAKDLTYIYGAGLPWERKALDGVSFSVEEGEFVGLIGETGSGKSTLVQILNGILRPTAGEVLLDGINIFKEKALLSKVRFQIGLIFQFPEQQLFAETVFEDVAFGPRNMGLGPEEVSRRVEEALLKVGLNPLQFRNRSPFSLSGGEKRLVAIAGVLAMKPRVLILDEVTAGLDPKGKKEILARIQLLHQKEKATIIMVSHDMDEISALAQKIIILKGGRVVLSGTPEEVFSRGEVIEAQGLALPTIPKLFYSLKQCGWDLPATVLDLKEACRLIKKELTRASG